MAACSAARSSPAQYFSRHPNTLQHAKRNRLIVLHRRQALGIVGQRAPPPMLLTPPHSRSAFTYSSHSKL